MRKVELRMNELFKFEVIENVVHRNCSKNRAALKLGCSKRTINRLIKKYEEYGKEGFVHGNRNRKPSISIDPSIKSYKC